MSPHTDCHGKKYSHIFRSLVSKRKNRGKPVVFASMSVFSQNGRTERLTPKELYCVMGCNDAMTKYFSQIKTKLLTPPAPALVADSRNATSVKLEWNFPEAKREGLSLHVQWKQEELSAAWHYCRNASWESDKVVLVENLKPYTKYRVGFSRGFGRGRELSWKKMAVREWESNPVCACGGSIPAVRSAVFSDFASMFRVSVPDRAVSGPPGELHRVESERGDRHSAFRNPRISAQ